MPDRPKRNKGWQVSDSPSQAGSGAGGVLAADSQNDGSQRGEDKKAPVEAKGQKGKGKDKGKQKEVTIDEAEIEKGEEEATKADVAEAKVGKGEEGVSKAVVADILSHLNCGVCLDLLAIPCLLPCGHSFCSGCVRSHLSGLPGRKKWCPACRARVVSAPATNLILNDVISALLPSLPEQIRTDHNSRSSTFRLLPNPWQFLAPTLFNPIFDTADNVVRCPQCLHEVEDGESCTACGAVFDPEFEYSDDGEDLFSDEEGFGSELEEYESEGIDDGDQMVEMTIAGNGFDWGTDDEDEEFGISDGERVDSEDGVREVETVELLSDSGSSSSPSGSSEGDGSGSDSDAVRPKRRRGDRVVWSPDTETGEESEEVPATRSSKRRRVVSSSDEEEND